ncbi:hypothetical protein N0V90_009126 [Kalmusia sp. IMI 367209]|nr:hypothetical protein N0V90_009126 [Kalmusia sp. IMI 367209]
MRLNAAELPNLLQHSQRKAAGDMKLKGNNIGPHVLDYFKHVSPRSLKTMGLALINRSGSPETLLLYSICVNSAAFKFINTILSGSDIEDVEDGMRARAATYLSSVKVAMARIQLLSTPSLAFIAQGTGDSTACWAFISAACKVCEDLGLHSRVEACRAETEDDEEIFYCYIWCHLLDKNYSMMLGRSRCLLEYEGVDLAFSHPFNRSMSALLTTYLHFVPIQALFVAELHPSKIVNDSSLVSSVEFVVQDLLERDYSAFMRELPRTALYHPLTPFFVLFCNVVATSHKEDFKTLELVTSQLDELVDLSPSIARLQILFKAFVGLCKGLVADSTDTYSPSGREREHGAEGGHTRDFVITSHPSLPLANEQTQFERVGGILSPQQASSNSSTPVDLIRPPHEDITGFVDPGWGLFDIQPTLDWLDADFSFIDSNE